MQSEFLLACKISILRSFPKTLILGMNFGSMEVHVAQIIDSWHRKPEVQGLKSDQGFTVIPIWIKFKFRAY